MTRITVILKREERAALMRLAQNERRDERAQAAWIIRQQLERLGLLPPAPSTLKQEAADVRQPA